MGFRRFILVVGLATLPLVAGTASASAQTDLGSSHGFRYLQSDPALAPSGQATSEIVNCGATEPAVGGGINVGGTASEAWITASRPVMAGVDTNAWETVINNQLGAAKQVQGYAICRKAGFVGLKVPQSPITQVRPYHTATAKVSCPGTSMVLGGGPGLGADVVLSTLPFDGKDADQRPDDGWKAKVYDDTAHKENFVVYGVCTTKGLRKLSYRTGRATTFTGPQGVANKADCPSDKAVVSGGVSIAGPDAKSTTINTDVPADTGDFGSVPDNRWSAFVWASAGTGGGVTTRAFAVCFG